MSFRTSAEASFESTSDTATLGNKIRAGLPTAVAL